MADKQQTLVSNIVYLTSLVSDIQHIDPWLDRMRAITAQHNSGQLSPQDEQTLLGLQSQLKDYLIHTDPFRRFDPDVLEQKMYENLQGSRYFNRLRITIGFIIGLAIGLGAGILMVSRMSGMQVLPQLPYLVGFGTLCLGAIFLLAQAAQTFNHQLRQVYYLLCLAVVLTAALAIQFSLYPVIGDSWWMKSWAFSALYAGIGLFFYLAFRTLATQLGLGSAFTRIKIILAVLAAAVGLSVLAPHATTDLPELVYDASVLGLVVMMAFSAISVILGQKVVKRVGALYTKAIWCLIIAAIVGAVDGLNLLIIRLVWLGTNQAPLFFSISSMVLAACVGGLLLYSSYVFNKTSRH